MNTRVMYATSHDGVRVAASVRGSGFPLVYLPLPLFSHAALEPFLEHERTWRERLARRHQFISIDLRGSGLADRHCGTHTFDDYVGDICAILDALDIEATDLHARGLRTSVAIRFVVQHPERVRRLILSGVTVGPTAASGRSPLVDGIGREFLKKDYRGYLETAASRVLSSEAHVSQYADRMERCSDHASMVAALDALHREDIREDIAQIRCPCLLLVRQDSTMITPGQELAFQELVPQTEVVYFSNTPLLAYLDDQSEAIERFEDRLDAAEGRIPLRPTLSVRESEVLSLLATGCSNAEIAADLTLSVRTVERHITTVYTTLGVRNRTEATRWAIENGLDNGWS